MLNVTENLENYLYLDSFKISNKTQDYPVFKKNILYGKCLIVYLESYYENNKVLDFIFLNFPYLYRLKDFNNFIKKHNTSNITKLKQDDIKKLSIGVNFDYTNDILFTENFEFISTMDDEGSFVMYFYPELKEKFIEYIKQNKSIDYSSNFYTAEYFQEYTEFLYKHYYNYLIL